MSTQNTEKTDETVAQIRETINRPEVRETWQEVTQVNKANVNTQERFASILGGSALVFYGLLRRSPWGLNALLAGGYLLYRGITGYCPAYNKLGINTLSIEEQQQLRTGAASGERIDRPNPGPEHTIEPADTTDEKLWETFPASDPPASW